MIVFFWTCDLEQLLHVFIAGFSAQLGHPVSEIRTALLIQRHLVLVGRLLVVLIVVAALFSVDFLTVFSGVGSGFFATVARVLLLDILAGGYGQHEAQFLFILHESQLFAIFSVI